MPALRWPPVWFVIGNVFEGDVRRPIPWIRERVVRPSQTGTTGVGDGGRISNLEPLVISPCPSASTIPLSSPEGPHHRQGTTIETGAEEPGALRVGDGYHARYGALPTPQRVAFRTRYRPASCFSRSAQRSAAARVARRRQGWRQERGQRGERWRRRENDGAHGRVWRVGQWQHCCAPHPSRTTEIRPTSQTEVLSPNFEAEANGNRVRFRQR